MDFHWLHSSGRDIFADRRSNPTLRMAPMVDVVFLLLIFFMVAAKFRSPESSLPLNAAVFGPAATVKAEPLLITITNHSKGCQVQIGPDRRVIINAETIYEDLSVLADEITLTLQERKRLASDPVEIVCADDIKWDYVAKIYNLLIGMGLSDVAFVIME